MKFDELIEKPIEDMTESEIEELVRKLKVEDIGKIEKKITKLAKKKVKKSDVDTFDQIVGVKKTENVS